MTLILSMEFTMASEWHTLASQQVFLAKSLLDGEGLSSDHLYQEALRQGAIELALRARHSLLKMIARYYQQSPTQVDSLESLASLIGAQAMEVERLSELARQGGSWWSHLDQLEHGQANPPVKKKTISDDNIIAVAASAGPDRSSSALATTLSAMKQFINALTEQHDEW